MKPPSFGMSLREFLFTAWKAIVMASKPSTFLPTAQSGDGIAILSFGFGPRETEHLLKPMPWKAQWTFAVAIGANGVIAAGSAQGDVALWDEAGAFIKALARERACACRIRFSPDAKALLVGARVLDAASGAELAAYRGHGSIPGAIAVSPDGTLAASSDRGDFAIHLWDIKDGKPRGMLAGNRAAGPGRGLFRRWPHDGLGRQAGRPGL